MAVPTITSVSPSQIYTGGQMITIVGTGFRTRYPVPPETPHPWPAPLPTVSVVVGGRQANRVVVLSSTQLTCVTASHDPGTVAVAVQNLDVNGAAIPGESVTASDLLRLTRVDLTVKSDLARVIETLVTELKRQVIENVQTTTAVDYDSDPDSVVFAGIDLARVPALCLVGPVLDRNRFYNMDGRPIINVSGEYQRRTTFECQDLNFRLLCLDNHSLRSINLQALVTQFFKSNNYLSFDRDPNDLAKGQVRYELEGGPFESTSVNNDSDLRACSGPVTIKGFQFEDVAGFGTQSIVERTTEVADFDVVQVPFPSV